MSLNEWTDMSIYWDRLHGIAQERDRQKSSYATSKLLCAHSTNFIGLVGEKCLALKLGLDIDERLLAQGDGGKDFVVGAQRHDIKTTTYYNDPYLVEFLPEDKLSEPSDIYFLAVVMEPVRLCRIAGWVTREKLLAADTRDFGHGPRLCIPERELSIFDGNVSKAHY